VSTKPKRKQIRKAEKIEEQPMVLSLDQIEERLVKSVLSGTLALHILRNSRKPTPKLLEDLFSIEAEVGRFVGVAMQMHTEHQKPPNLKGVLAGALSFIPIQGRPQASKPSLSKPKKKSGRSGSKVKKREP
jgi:hypothetical protein